MELEDNKASESEGPPAWGIFNMKLIKRSFFESPFHLLLIRKSISGDFIGSGNQCLSLHLSRDTETTYLADLLVKTISECG